jgi:hypothetical protein
MAAISPIEPRLDDPPIVEMRCTDSYIVAHVIEDALLAAGIAAIVLDDHVGLDFGVRIVRMLLDARQQGRARELVEAARRANDGLPEWICSDCGESSPATFELCWNCQADRRDEDAADPVEQPALVAVHG